MMHNGSSIKLLTGNSHPELAQMVATRLGINLTPCTVQKFSDNETGVQITDSVREEDVFILQTGFNPSPHPFGAKARHYGHDGNHEVPRPGTPLPPLAKEKDLSSRPTSPSKPAPQPFNDPNDLLMELLIMISACKTASAKRITAVIPCFPYARMDRKDKSRSPITAKLVANMLQIAGCDHVITMDLHASQIQGFFEVPVDNLWTEPSMVRWVKENIADWKEAIIVSPDAGGAKRATNLADRLDVDFALINRNRSKGDGPDSEGKMELLVGDVKDKVAILIDDMADTGGTIKLATQTLVEKGAKEVYALVSHGLLSGETMAELAKMPIVKVVVSNTISQAEHLKQANGKLEVMDISPVLAESIRMLNPTKCTFGARSGKLLGFVVSEKGIEIDSNKVQAIQELSLPRTQKEVRGFLGRLNYIARFISQLTEKCDPIFRLLKKHNPGEWDDECQKAFDKIKEYLSSPPVLSPPSLDRLLILYLTMFGNSMGRVFGQHDESGRKEKGDILPQEEIH